MSILEQDAKNVRNEIEKRFEWIGVSSEGELIQSVINSAESFKGWDVLKAREKYLKKIFSFLLRRLFMKIGGSPFCFGSHWADLLSGFNRVLLSGVIEAGNDREDPLIWFNTLFLDVVL